MTDAIQALQQQLKQVLDQLQHDRTQRAFGNPAAIERETAAIKRLFDGYTSDRPPANRPYQAACQFFRDYQALSSDDYDYLAAALGLPIQEYQGRRVIECEEPIFVYFMKYYRLECQHQRLWRLAWYWLFQSCFSIDWPREEDRHYQRTRANLQALRQFLADTQAQFTATSPYMPTWAKFLQQHPALLSAQPYLQYVPAVIAGNYHPLEEIKTQLAIPSRSWFWRELTQAVVDIAVKKPDPAFKAQLPQLMSYLKQYPEFQDEALQKILERYHQCLDRTVIAELRDFVTHPEVWKSPKLRPAGLAPKWHYVSDPVWRMVLGWVTREHLRLFFEIIATRQGAKLDRFHFWLQYIQQITYTKLVFGHETYSRQQFDPDIKRLFETEEGLYALLSGDKTLDAFIIQIGAYTIVEFSKQGNAAFIYDNNQLPFDLDAQELKISNLKGWPKPPKYKINHHSSWQHRTRERLANELGIFPDPIP